MSIMWKTSNIGQTCLQEHKNLFTIPSRKSDEKEKEKEKKNNNQNGNGKALCVKRKCNGIRNICFSPVKKAYRNSNENLDFKSINDNVKFWATVKSQQKIFLEMNQGK